MKKIILPFLLISLLVASSYAQTTWNSLWRCVYATYDDQPNSTGYNTPGLGVFKENSFVAVVNRPANNTAYLVGYRNADSANGRVGRYPYGTAGIGGYRQRWESGFDVVEMLRPWDCVVHRDSIIYVANNDTLDRNILVFYLTKDTIISSDYRMSTGDNKPIFAIDMDQNGRIYVTKEGDTTANKGSVLVYKSIDEDPNWGFLHISTPMTVIQVPDLGFIRGVAVTRDARIVYVSNYTARKVYCYIGSPTTGYTLYNGFNFSITDTVPNAPALRPGPLGLKFMPTKNLLFVACAAFLGGGAGYTYSRVYMVNPNTGAIIDTIDAAAWNFYKTGAYNTRGGGGTQGDVSGYASLYNVDVDEKFNVYTQSHYGWTVDKWTYGGTLPTIPITILGVEKIDGIPQSFELYQNYPNPFNPTTTIQFSLAKDSEIDLVVYDALGEKVTELISNAKFEKGNYKVEFDASKLASGTYVYTLKAGEQKISKKMVFMK